MILHHASILLLILIAALCLLGIFHPAYEDSALERVGMSVISLWCLSRAYSIQVGHSGDDVSDLGELILYVGMLCYAVAAAYRAWQLHQREWPRAVTGLLDDSSQQGQ